MPEPLSVGDIHKNLKAQAEASQKIYQMVVELANIADEAKSKLDDALKRRLAQVTEDLLNVGDALSESIDETSKRILKSLETAR